MQKKVLFFPILGVAYSRVRSHESAPGHILRIMMFCHGRGKLVGLNQHGEWLLEQERSQISGSRLAPPKSDAGGDSVLLPYLTLDKKRILDGYMN